MKSILTGLCFAFAFSAFGDSQKVNELTEKVIALEQQVSDYSYMFEYYAGLPVSSVRVVDCGAWVREAAQTEAILIGDLHGTLPPVRRTQRILKELVDAGQNPALVVEFVFHQYQPEVDRFLRGEITSAELRKNIRYDDFEWSWNWDYLTEMLITARELGLRVIAGEEGSNDMTSRDRFTAKVIAEDLAAHPGSQYVVFFGVAHVAGKNHLGDWLEQFGVKKQVRMINFLGRLTAEVQHRTEDSACYAFDQGFFIEDMNHAAMVKDLEEYYEELKKITGQEN